jgi:type II secretory pathway pseudopilin PulG
LIELLVVIAIIAILAGLTLSTLGYVNRKGAESRAKSEVAALSSAIDRFHMDHGIYPASEALLYRELTGDGEVNRGTLYFEPSGESLRAGMFMSPWGSPYKYNSSDPTQMRNVGFYDLWVEPPGAESETDWIHN